MPLQNRVTPFGEIVAITQRGTFTGNRGILHDPATKTLLKRRWALKAWITCALEYKGMHREVMARRSWTELFFFDEAIALAAGHRPCFFCRRGDAVRFRTAWEGGNARSHQRATDIDAVLHAERLDGKVKRTYPFMGPAADLPEGTVFASGERVFAVTGAGVRQWTADGYRAAGIVPSAVAVLTPPSTVRALAAGYRPAFHPSAGIDASQPLEI